MNILILNWRDIKNPLAGGAEIATHEHAKAWAKAGHEVTLYSSSFTKAKPFEKIDGVKIVRRGSHYTVHLHAFFYCLTALRGKIDLVVDEFHFIPFFTPLYFRGKKLAFIHETAKELWFENRIFPLNVIGYLVEPLFFKLYKNITFMTVSKSTKSELIEFGIKEDKIKVIHNGVEKVEVTDVMKEKVFTIIYLGRLAKDKGIEDALITFKNVLKEVPEARFWIVGREEKKGYQSLLENQAKNLKIFNKIEFFGHVDDKKKFELLKRAWVLIHPSVKEGWGLVNIEANAMGTPVVGYDVAGMRDSILHNKTGVLVPYGETKLISKAIIDLFRNTERYRYLSNEAVKWSKQFTWEEATKESTSLIEKILTL